MDREFTEYRDTGLGFSLFVFYTDLCLAIALKYGKTPDLSDLQGAKDLLFDQNTRITINTFLLVIKQFFKK